MSEKLYKVVKAVDLLDGYDLVPERCLVFEDQDGDTDKVFFPKDRTSIIHDGVLYDWYGRQVKIASGIKRIVEPFGHRLDNYAYETYLVEKEDGRLAIADLSTISFSFYDPNFSMSLHTKNAILGNLILNRQELKCRDRSFEKFFEQPIEDTCFKVLNYAGKYKILLGVSDKNVPKIHPLIVFQPYIERHTGCMRHLIFKDRTSFLRCAPEGISSAICSTNFLRKHLFISDDGNKATTYLSHGYDPVFDRISTDMEVLLHAKNSLYVPWYYDPEP